MVEEEVEVGGEESRRCGRGEGLVEEWEEGVLESGEPIGVVIFERDC